MHAAGHQFTLPRCAHLQASLSALQNGVLLLTVPQNMAQHIAKDTTLKAPSDFSQEAYE